jgi:hypothetical protein
MNLFACQLAPLCWSHPGECEAAESGAGEFLDRHSKELEHIAQFAVSRFDERHSDHRIAAVVFDEFKLRHCAAGNRAFDAGFASIALAHPADFDPHRIECSLVDLPLDQCFIDLRHIKPRMRQQVRQLAVVGHNHQTGGFEIEPAYWEEPCFRRMVNDFHDRRTIELGLVGIGNKHAFGLVHHQVELAFDRLQWPPVNHNPIVARIDKNRKSSGNLAVDADAPGLDHFLACAPRGDSSIGHHSLQANTPGIVIVIGRANTFLCH